MPKNQEFTGWIVGKEQKKVYDKNEWYGNPFFRLTAIKEANPTDTCHHQPQLTLFVYSNVVSPQIFKTIEQSQYVDKKYYFFCEKRKRGLMLHDWKELS